MLGRRNLTLEQASYLRGKRYLQEKKTHGGDRKSIRQNDGLKETAEKLAEELKVSPRTIERDAQFAEAIDIISENTGEEFRQSVLSGDTDLTKEAIVTMAGLFLRILVGDPGVAGSFVVTGKPDVDIDRSAGHGDPFLATRTTGPSGG